jgi:hypothetical protein
MKAPVLAFVSAAFLLSPVSADESIETKVETLVNDAVKKLKPNDYSEVWKSFSAKSRNTLRLLMLNHLQLHEELAKRDRNEAPPAKEKELTPFEKLQLENDPEFRKQAENHKKHSEDPAGYYVNRVLHQWGFETNLEETAKLSNEQFWKVFVEHMEDQGGDSFRPFMADDARLEIWKSPPTGKWTHQVTSVTTKDGKVIVETTVPRYDYFHGSYRALFLLPLPMDPKEKDKERFPFTWSATIHGGKPELDVPPPVLENFRKWNEGLNRRLNDP